ncbi:DUF3073 domain-containing protein [Propioniciclava soli]|uniref:DUF3073 domain-containing protein n=1 Tax=Propioniciclava soli TaxID=2775081 RepID=A0ABZ3C6S2_9ACTN
MGRGRAKAKQTKVARDLKYRTVDTDFSSLERELRDGTHAPWVALEESDDFDDDPDADDGDPDDEPYRPVARGAS